jgi:hypothetical protein
MRWSAGVSTGAGGTTGALISYAPAHFDMCELRESAIRLLNADGYEVAVRYETI